MIVVSTITMGVLEEMWIAGVTKKLGANMGLVQS